MSTFQWRLDGFSEKYISLYLYLGLFFENRKNSGLTLGQNDDPVTRKWKMTQMTQWPNDPVPCLACARAAAAGSVMFWAEVRGSTQAFYCYAAEGVNHRSLCLCVCLSRLFSDIGIVLRACASNDSLAVSVCFGPAVRQAMHLCPCRN